MAEIKEKISYLMGLAAGLELNKDSKEGKIFDAVIDVLKNMADDMDQLVENQEDTEKYLEALDMDLGELEAEFYGEEDDLEEDEFDQDIDNYLEIECPNCHEVVYSTQDHSGVECETEQND